MTHRTDIAAVEITEEIIDVVKLAIDEGFSRIPIYEEDLDNIKGIVYVKDLLKFVGTEIPKGEKIEDYIRTPLFVPETIPCGKLFAQMTETHIQLAIVVDEYGGTAGLVTMEDIIEELVGEIEDEYDDEEQSVTKIDDDTFVLTVLAILKMPRKHLALICRRATTIQLQALSSTDLVLCQARRARAKLWNTAESDLPCLKLRTENRFN